MSQQEQRQELRQQFDQITKEDSQVRMTTLPLKMVEEAQFALNQYRQQIGDFDISPDQALSVVEPLVKAIGWAEALVYALDKTSHREVIDTLAGNGVFAGKK